MLLDTSGLLCCLDAADRRHAEAVARYGAAGRKLTHSYVLAELVALGDARRIQRKRVLGLAVAISDAEDVEVVWVAEELHRHAIAYLERRLDKHYSLCDAVSFLVMKERGISEALTTDKHFEQAGFKRLLNVA